MCENKMQHDECGNWLCHYCGNTGANNNGDIMYMKKFMHMKNELALSEFIRRDRETKKLMDELESSYPFLQVSNELQRWNELLQDYLFHDDTKLKEKFLKDYGKAIEIFSNLYMRSKPFTSSSPIGCKVFVAFEHKYGRFRGWARTVDDFDTDY